MRVIMRRFLLLIVILFTTELIYAQQTEPSANVDAKSLRIEGGFSYQCLKGNLINNHTFGLPSLLFRYGLNKNIELRIGNLCEYHRIVSENTTEEGFCFGNVEIGAKAQLLKSNTEIAFFSHIILPKKDFLLNKFGIVNTLTISHYLSDKYSFGYSLGYNYFEEASATYSLYFNRNINENATVYLETFGEYDLKNDFSQIANLGFTYVVNKLIDVDITVGKGLFSKTNFYSIIISCNI